MKVKVIVFALICRLSQTHGGFSHSQEEDGSSLFDPAYYSPQPATPTDSELVKYQQQPSSRSNSSKDTVVAVPIPKEDENGTKSVQWPDTPDIEVPEEGVMASPISPPLSIVPFNYGSCPLPRDFTPDIPSSSTSSPFYAPDSNAKESDQASSKALSVGGLTLMFRNGTRPERKRSSFSRTSSDTPSASLTPFSSYLEESATLTPFSSYLEEFPSISSVNSEKSTTNAYDSSFSELFTTSSCYKLKVRPEQSNVALSCFDISDNFLFDYYYDYKLKITTIMAVLNSYSVELVGTCLDIGYINNILASRGTTPIHSITFEDLQLESSDFSHLFAYTHSLTIRTGHFELMAETGSKLFNAHGFLITSDGTRQSTVKSVTLEYSGDDGMAYLGLSDNGASVGYNKEIKYLKARNIHSKSVLKLLSRLPNLEVLILSGTGFSLRQWSYFERKLLPTLPFLKQVLIDGVTESTELVWEKIVEINQLGNVMIMSTMRS